MYLFISLQACAVGCDIVVLASDFQRVQVIRNDLLKNAQQVTCIDCCNDTGKVRVLFSFLLLIFCVI
jgi:hypothetical protein